MTDCTRIFDYMQTHGSITSYEAVTELGCIDLRRRITDPTRAGVNIVKTWRKGVDRFGERTRYIEYSLGVEV